MSFLLSRNDGFVDFQKYRYSPSMAAAILFTILFALTTSVHLFQLLRSRTYFMLPFLIGGLFEITGYIGRTISSTELTPYTLGPYILQTVALLVAPALLAASIYMLLGRIAIATKAEDKLLIRRTWLTKIFVAGDVVSFLAQSAGGGILGGADSQNSIDTGTNIIVGGLFLQIVFFGLFVVVAGLFHSRLHQHGTRSTVPWKKHLFALYAVSILIFVRSIVRVVEFLQGYQGYIISHEVFLYVFDGMLMFLAMVAMNVVHPGEIGRFLKRGDVEKGVNKGVESDGSV